ncbi:flavin reductase like domain-containing protein [Blastocladiella britannica]|nr:flavin reductase like domain-containing protein [Blastocladiella britannica]
MSLTLARALRRALTTSAAANGGDASTAFRAAMRRQAFPVCVLSTAWAAERPTSGPRHRLATISSFTSVSLSPPIVSFALRHPSRFGDALASRPDRAFALHLLAHDQAELSVRFADPATQTDLDGVNVVDWIAPDRAVPVLGDCLAVLECVLEPGAPVAVGDHTLWFGRVVRALDNASTKSSGNKKPLLYVNREYTTTAEETFGPPPTAPATNTVPPAPATINGKQ